MFNSPEHILKNFWGYSFFRKGQAKIIDSILEGKDVLGILPTGAGKSICYQVPGIALGGTTLVITPLISLMRDQQQSLLKKGIKAYTIHAGMSQEELDSCISNCSSLNIPRFLFISPERLNKEKFKGVLALLDIRLVVVDEAHCISQWGDDFRPSYANIYLLRNHLPPDVAFLALTASATKHVEKDIVHKLAFRDLFAVYKGDFSRPNLHYIVKKSENKEHKLFQLLRQIEGSKIVYCNSRRATVSVAKVLKENGLNAIYYHAGLEQDERAKRQEYWFNDKAEVIVATNAFGMGIDKSDVRLVVHFQPPKSLESFYQEAGRAGRDEDKALSILLYNYNDIETLQNEFKLSFPDKNQIVTIYNILCNHYQLAQGVRPESSLDFDFNDISKKNSLSISEVYHAIKSLEAMGIITANKDFYSSSRMKVLLSSDDLYRFQVGYKDYEPFIKVLQRRFGANVFLEYFKIDESLIADALGLPVAEVTTKLLQLHKMGVVDYRQSKQIPQLTFVEPRLSNSDLKLRYSIVEELKTKKKMALKAMLSFLDQKNKCRAQFISDYFDSSIPPCGACDNCRRGDLDRVEDDILELLLKEESLSLDFIFNTLIETPDGDIKKVIRRQVDLGKWKYKEGKLSIA